MLTDTHVEPLLSIHGASEWLRAQGVKQFSRHALLAAIARGRLRIAASANRVTLIHCAELERYARELREEQGRATAASA